MSAVIGFAWEDENGLDIRSLTDTERGVKVNVLAIKGISVTLNHSDGWIDQKFETHLGKLGKIVPVRVEKTIDE